MFDFRANLGAFRGFVLTLCVALVAGCIPQPITLPALPGVPTNLLATADNAVVTLSWTASSDATGYGVKRSTTSGGPYAIIANATTPQYTDSSVTNGTTYFYVVYAYNTAGNSTVSAETSASPALPSIPLAPTHLVVTVGDTQLAISWAATGGATSYHVRRSLTSGGSYTLVASPASATYTDTGLTNGTTYYYVVSAVNSLGESPDSMQVNGTPSPPPPTTFGTWTNITPAGINLTDALTCGNFGTTSVEVDRAHPATLYTLFYCQGIWKSTDNGATWTGPINTGTSGTLVGDCAGGVAVASTGGVPVLYATCYRGQGFGGIWRSADGGVNWVHYAVAVTPREDYLLPLVDPYDANHLIMTGHEHTGFVESIDGGQHWTVVPQTAGMLQNFFTSFAAFIDTGDAVTTRSTWLWAQLGGSGAGTWRTTNRGTSWTQVDKNEGGLISSQMTYQPDTGGVLFLAGDHSNLGAGVLRSTDYGQTWAHVGVNKPQAVVVGTARIVYSMGSQNAGFQLASQPGTGLWVEPAIPSVLLNQGPAQIAAVNDGTHNILVGAMGPPGLWRYVEP